MSWATADIALYLDENHPPKSNLCSLKTANIREAEIRQLIIRALQEDIKSGDVTTNAIVDESARARALWIAKEQGIVAGLEIARMIFRSLDEHLEWLPKVDDGDEVEAGEELVEMSGQCRAILTAERTALNFVQRLSGIATKTNAFVQTIKDLPTRILDTRKTLPGFRELDKYAVTMGGGKNHRMGLYDLAMIKDNHIAAAGGIAEAVECVRRSDANIKIEVETTSLDEVNEAVAAGVDIIMLDNMDLTLMGKAVSLIGPKAKTEASGNVTLARLKQIAETGVDFISVGALTHSVKALDISQQLQKIK